MAIKITDEQKEKVEAKIKEQVKSFNYDTLEYPLEVIIQYYFGAENQLLIPDDNKTMTWNEDQQSNFIEFVILGLPIPPIFVVDLSESSDSSRLKVIDGKQRIRTLINFINNELNLSNLKQLATLNGLTFKDLLASQQRYFKRTTIRMILLSKETDEEAKIEIINRYNRAK